MVDDWREVPGHGAMYQVSALGQVKSFHGLEPRILKGYVDRYGYRTVLLSQKRFKIHRLVCAAFHGPAQDGKEVGHLNGQKDDNRAANLAWVTRSENTRHQIEHGTYVSPSQSGDRHPAAKLKPEQVQELRSRRAQGETTQSLADAYGISRCTVNQIVRRDTWAHLPTAFAQEGAAHLHPKDTQASSTETR